MKQFGTVIKFETLVFTSSRQNPSKTFEWHGFVQTIKDCITSQNIGLNEQITNEFSIIDEQIIAVETRIDQKMQSEMGKAQKRINTVIADLNEIQRTYADKPREVEWVEDADEDSDSD